MKTRKIIAGMVMFMLFYGGVVSGGTQYYVSQDGNDSDGLSWETAFQTIQKAADTMIAGDTVDINAGTYVEQVEPNNSGSEGNWITYQAYENDEVTIESPNTVWSDYCINLRGDRSLEYLHFKNLTLDGVRHGVGVACFKAVGDAMGGEVKSHIILEDLTIKNARHGVAFRDGVTDSNIIDCNICYNGTGISFADAIQNILISGNHISYSYDDPDPNIFSHGDGIVTTCWNFPISDGNMCSDITITNNIVHDVNSHGVCIAASKNVLVRGNRCHHNGGNGILIEGSAQTPGCKNVVIEDNLCEDNACISAGGTGIWVDDSDDILVQNNILRRNHKGLAITGAFNVIARNNIIYENNSSTYDGTAGILAEKSYVGQRACENSIIVHNTLYRNAGEANSVCAQVTIGRLGSNLPADNAVFKNNISSCSLGDYYCTYLDLMVYGQNPELNYNNYYQPVEPLNVCWQSDPDVNIISWSQYQTSGQDSNSIISDPCFINIDNEDFHLHPNSKCIDAGGFLTTAADSNSGISLVVADSRYFTDGYGLIDGDLIKVGSNPLVRVLDVNYDTNTLTLSESISWNDGDGVSYAYLGNAPDIGAYEYGPLVYNKSQDTSYESIQAAINEASSSDEIIVYPWTYYESVDFNGVACTLRSANSNDWGVAGATVIDGNGANNSILFNSGEGSGSVLTGFTITGATINGIYSYFSSPIVSKCIIRNNAARGLCNVIGATTITNNKIYNNGDYNIYLQYSAADLTIKNNLIYDADYGIRIHVPQGVVIVSNNTIVSNKVYGIARLGGTTSPTITNCIVWDCNDDLYNCSATYSCIQDGDAGTGNISSDPCFVDAANHDYHLKPNSPCINTGDPNFIPEPNETDIDGEPRVMLDRVDMGADETLYPDAHWWKFDECNGVTAYDSIDDDDGTFNGNDPCWVSGKFGCAVDFNGVNDYFSVSSLDTAYSDGNVFTIAGWFKTDQSTGKQTIVGQWSQSWDAGQEYYGWQVLVENNKVIARFGHAVDTYDITGTTAGGINSRWFVTERAPLCMLTVSRKIRIR